MKIICNDDIYICITKNTSVYKDNSVVIKFNNVSSLRPQKAHLMKEVSLLLLRFKVFNFDNVLNINSVMFVISL